ncbi:MAG: hypothetical protein ACRDY7_10050, partial [Acidimicrobiia bacterium]
MRTTHGTAIVGGVITGSRLEVHVEAGLPSRTGSATVAWTFDPAFWGVCGQGRDECSAVLALAGAVGRPVRALAVVERIDDPEECFARDRVPATLGERRRTAAILGTARHETLRLVAEASPAVLDWVDPCGPPPSCGNWRTLRQVAWHVADTESRVYPGRLGLPARAPTQDLLTELRRSHDHVLGVVADVPGDLCAGGWTTVKMLRRLAWHERAEVGVMRDLCYRARAA